MSKHHKYAILKRPLITEKSTLMQEDGRYVFEVAKTATKLEVKEAVQEVFGVRIVGNPADVEHLEAPFVQVLQERGELSLLELGLYAQVFLPHG